MRSTLLLPLVLVCLVACDRSLDLREPPKTFPEPSAPEAKDVKLVDTDLGTEAHAACETRPVGACVGSNDFPCDFGTWVRETAERCQLETECRTNGTLVVRMDDAGCVTAILMDEPNDAIVLCLVAAFAEVRCPCSSAEESYYFGFGHDGCDDDPG
ncbi:MAG: hypothetical protein EXR75_14510 [Myxococcales bacterium]|nr:hypothetical protein [Myxococcales bacterium]